MPDHMPTVNRLQLVAPIQAIFLTSDLDRIDTCTTNLQLTDTQMLRHKTVEQHKNEQLKHKCKDENQ